ncbi:MAG: hypothetical protein WAX04_01845 [Oscillospiraceae bacterium]
MRNKKRMVITIIAVATAIVGVAVAIGAYLKRKADDISEKLDFDGDLYYEDEDYFDDEITAPEESIEEDYDDDELSSQEKE